MCRVPFVLTTVEASSTGELRSRLLAFKHQSVQTSPAHQGDIYEYFPLGLLTRCFIQRLFTTFSSSDIICHHLKLSFSWSFFSTGIADNVLPAPAHHPPHAQAVDSP
jgi:hypothetical protein